jgi:GNAT superfamily N-acetyltransferase
VSRAGYELVIVTDPGDWARYHEIRKAELFDRRGRGGAYDPHHPDERARNHYPLLLTYEGRGIATARLDVVGNGDAIVRRVAVTRAEQRKGHGRVLDEMVGQFARRRGVRRLLVNAAAEAVGYYRRIGYEPAIWSMSEPSDGHPHVQMMKRLG